MNLPPNVRAFLGVFGFDVNSGLAFRPPFFALSDRTPSIPRLGFANWPPPPRNRRFAGVQLLPSRAAPFLASVVRWGRWMFPRLYFVERWLRYRSPEEMEAGTSVPSSWAGRVLRSAAPF